MPGLCLHINIGNLVLENNSHLASNEYPGSFFLGTTAPDIRSFTGQDRKETHFFDLNIHTPQDPLHNLSTEYPGLLSILSEVSPQSAFIAGYVTHLLADKRYIELIYRKYFLRNTDSDFDPNDEDQLVYNLFDRTLQFEIDRQEREKQEDLINALNLINAQNHAYNIPFINDIALNQWCGIMISIVAQPPFYDKYSHLMHSHLSKLGYTSDKISKHVNDYKKNIDDTFNIVTQENMKQFINETVKISINAITEQA
ncbi:MAG: hypothetical protein P8J51_03155 [Dehalococcoidia bacterium]|nr:hypothetical protein [Dehalococcoidia bacterium]